MMTQTKLKQEIKRETQNMNDAIEASDMYGTLGAIHGLKMLVEQLEEKINNDEE